MTVTRLDVNGADQGLTPPHSLTQARHGCTLFRHSSGAHSLRNPKNEHQNPAKQAFSTAFRNPPISEKHLFLAGFFDSRTVIFMSTSSN